MFHLKNCILNKAIEPFTVHDASILLNLGSPKLKKFLFSSEKRNKPLRPIVFIKH